MTTLGGSHFLKHSVTLITGATLAVAMVLPVHADDSSKPSVTVGGGMGVAMALEAC